MIRVLHFIPAFGIGGVESLIMGLYRAIDKHKVQFDFLVETEEKRAEFDQIASMGGKVYKLKKLDKKNPFSYVREIREFFKKYASTIDVVHCHHIERATIVLYYARKYHIDFRIIHSHTDSIEDVKFSTVRKGFMRINSRLSTHRFACSDAAGKFQFKDKKPFIVLKNAIDSDKFSYNANTREKVRKKLGIKETNILIGHTGRFTYQKNHWRIIDIFAALRKKEPKAKLLLVGDGPLKLEMEEKAKVLGVDEAVLFLGERDDIAELLQAMDVFLLPSFYEGFCISLLEAQSTGLKCIASDVIPEEVQLTSLVETVSLDSNNDVWSQKILAHMKYDRVCHSKIIRQKGYDLTDSARFLEKFYRK